MMELEDTELRPDLLAEMDAAIAAATKDVKYQHDARVLFQCYMVGSLSSALTETPEGRAAFRRAVRKAAEFTADQEARRRARVGVALKVAQ
jgi:hypothetical protein